jgi:hypothetical protein
VAEATVSVNGVEAAGPPVTPSALTARRWAPSGRPLGAPSVHWPSGSAVTWASATGRSLSRRRIVSPAAAWPEIVIGAPAATLAAAGVAHVGGLAALGAPAPLQLRTSVTSTSSANSAPTAASFGRSSGGSQ